MVFLKDLCRPHVSELCNDNSPETKSDPIVSNSFFFFFYLFIIHQKVGYLNVSCISGK